MEGEYNEIGRTVVFPGVNAPTRTDQGFRDDEYLGHRTTITPLMDLRSFNIVEDVVVGDRLHLIDLGVMKRLLLGWRDGTLGKRKWSDSQYKHVNDALKDAKLPSEIHRKLRQLMHVGMWKGSEFASFLHYASVPNQQYLSKT